MSVCLSTISWNEEVKVALREGPGFTTGPCQVKNDRIIAHEKSPILVCNDYCKTLSAIFKLDLKAEVELNT